MTGWKVAGLLSEAEWAVLAETCMAAAKCLALARTLILNLDVHPERMIANLEASRGFILSEAVVLALARHTGKQTAHSFVYDAAMRAHEAGQPLKDALLADAEIRRHLNADEIESLFDYRRHVGLCRAMVERVVGMARED